MPSFIIDAGIADYYDLGFITNAKGILQYNFNYYTKNGIYLP